MRLHQLVEFYHCRRLTNRFSRLYFMVYFCSYARNPEQGRPKEQQPLPYSLAPRFPTKQAAEQPYVAAQETIHTADCQIPQG